MENIFSNSNNIEFVNTSNKRKNPIIYGATKYIDGYHDDIEFEIEILTPFANQVFPRHKLIIHLNRMIYLYH